jgi:hypothetical protein
MTPLADRQPRVVARRVKQPKSDAHVAGAVVSLVRALGVRCSRLDPDSAAYLVRVQAELDDAFATAVAGWRDSGFSDAWIGRELGVTKQAVQKRWPRQPQVVAGGGSADA